MPDWEVKRPLVAGAVGRNPYKTVKFRAKLSESRTQRLSPRILALLFSQFDCCVDGFSVHSHRGWPRQFQAQAWRIFSVKVQVVGIFSFAGHNYSVLLL